MDGDHDGSSLQEEQLVNGDMDVAVKGGGDCTSSTSQDMEVTGADTNNKCDKKAFSDTVVNHAEEDQGEGGGGGKKSNGLVNGEGEEDNVVGTEGAMNTIESAEIKNSKVVTGGSPKEKESSEGKKSEKDLCSEGNKSEKDPFSEENKSEKDLCSEGNKSEKDPCSEGNKSKKAPCDEKVDSEQGDVSMETDAGTEDSGDKVAEKSKDSQNISIEEIDKPVGKKDKPETISEKNTKSKDSENESKSDTTANSRKRKSFEENTIISSDDEIHEEIVIQKKPKLQKPGKPVIVFPPTIAPATKVTYSMAQTMSIGILPNQPGTVRMVIPSLQNKLMTPSGTPLIISPAQTSLFTTQGLNLGTAVLYPPLQAGSLATFAQGKQTFKARTPIVNKMSAHTTVTSSNASRQVLEMRTPNDSLDMIELVKWELRQGVYNRPKNFRIKPDSELGPMARLMRDFGQDLVKESVYSDLVRIQSRRGNQGKLSDKEKKDFEKLKSVHNELKEKVGPVMISLKKKCKCGFKTESENVMHWHKQFPHMDEYDLKCAYCDFDTRTNSVFVFHMEVEHGTTARFLGKPPFWECSLCPYETNLKNKLTQHRLRCGKSFKMNLNLHPSWLPGPETNFCLEKIFYKNPVLMSMAKQQARATMPIMPKKSMVTVGSRLSAPSSQSNRNPHLLASLNKKVQNVNRGQYQGRMAYPNVNIFQKSGNTSYVRTSVASNNVTNKINSLISMNNRVLDQKATPQPKANSGFEVCEICGGYVKDRTALRIHFFYAHRIDMPHGVFDRVHPPLYCATCFARFWTAQGLQKHLDVHKEDASGGVSGKCIVCLHRVPNILMHMKIVHNKAFVNFLRDCKCIFCGVKFHSKELVEAHMASVHGVVVKSGSQPTSGGGQGKKQMAKPQKGRKDSLVKGSVCVLCNLNFGRNVDLTRHCMRVHHTCMKCGMVVADKESLLRHTCLESPSGLRNCELCGERGFHPAYHVKHIRDKHLRKLSVRVKRLSKLTIAKYTRNQASSKQQMQSSDDPIELSESDDDDEPYSKRMKVDTRYDKNPQRTFAPGSRKRGPFRQCPKEADVVLLIDDSDEDVSKSDDKSKKKSDDNKEKSDDLKEKGNDVKDGKDKSDKAKTEGDVKSRTTSTSDVKDDENSKDSDSNRDKADDSAEKEVVKHKNNDIKKDIDKGSDDAKADSGDNKNVSAGDKDDDDSGDKDSSDKELI